MDSNKYLFMITGAPGSGKSTLAEKLMSLSQKCLGNPIGDICEADDFFIHDGKYEFNPKLLWKAHQECQSEVEELMSLGVNLIVSNTNIRPRDRKFYFDLARKYGYRVVYIHLTTDFGSIHDVPEDAVQRMIDSYTGPTPDELSLIVTSDEMTDELASLLAKTGVKYEY